MSKLCRLGRIKEGLFLDVFFERGTGPMKKEGEIVGLDLGFRRLAVLSDKQTVGEGLKIEVNRFYK